MASETWNDIWDRWQAAEKRAQAAEKRAEVVERDAQRLQAILRRCIFECEVVQDVPPAGTVFTLTWCLPGDLSSLATQQAVDALLESGTVDDPQP